MHTDQKTFLKAIVGETSLPAARAMASDIFMAADAANKADMIMIGTAANPFFVPELPAALEPAGLMSTGQLQKTVGFARAAAANTRSHRILFTAPPKSGSTFLSASLADVLGLRRVTLTLSSIVPYAHALFGGATNEQAVDELALLGNCLHPQGFIAHHHMTCSPLLADQLGVYGVRPILASRNIFDSLVSFDDHFRKAIPRTEGSIMLRHGLPADFLAREFDDRIAILIDLKLAWYVKYYMSWMACERAGLVKPLWIHYEQDVLGSKQELAEKVASALRLPPDRQTALAAAFAKEGSEVLNVNKGIAGRGTAITGENRQRVADCLLRYRSEVDLEFLLT
ncbi:MAG: hypothetical protein QM805_11705 [Pseudomonas sp.]